MQSATRRGAGAPPRKVAAAMWPDGGASAPECDLADLLADRPTPGATAAVSGASPTAAASPAKSFQYQLEGVEVLFPYQAYDCQLAYMAMVIRALKAGGNALLESPTGTGKTLCLLCAVLSWRRWMIGRAATRNEATSTLESTAAQSALMRNIPRVFYSSRTHSQLAQVMNELKRTSFTVRSGIIASREHLCINHSVVQLTSATARDLACNRRIRERTCEYFNRQDVMEQEMATYMQGTRDIEDMLGFGREKQVCPFFLSRVALDESDVILLPYNYLVDPAVRRSQRINLQNSIVIFDEGHNLEGFLSDAASMDLDGLAISGAVAELDRVRPLLSMYQGGYSAPAAKGDAHATSLGPKPTGQDDDQLDVGQGSGGKVMLTDSSVLVIKALLLEIERAIYALPLSPEGLAIQPGDAIYSLLGECRVDFDSFALLHPFIEGIVEILAADAERRRLPSSTIHMVAVRAFLRRLFDTEEGASSPLSTIEDLALSLTSGGGGPPAKRQLEAIKVARLQAAREFFKFVIQEERPSGSGPGSGGNFSMRGTAARKIGFWSFNPGLMMQEMAAQGVRSFIITSGTLSPLKSFAIDLRTPFEFTLENGHVIDPASQLYARVIPRGPNRVVLNSSFERRGSSEYLSELGLTLVRLMAVIPDGVLVFFPTYSVMASALAFWRRPGASGESLFGMMSRHKLIQVEPRSSKKDFEQAINDYHQSVNEAVEQRRGGRPRRRPVEGDKGALPLLSGRQTGGALFAVCRGKASEGVDFADSLSRGVIITGLPFAPYLDPRVKLKREILDESARRAPGTTGAEATLSGTEWYHQSAMRAVNQALGRSIRHRFDYSAVFLLDERFSRPTHASGLPIWFRQSLSTEWDFEHLLAGLAGFFQEAPERVAAAHSMGLNAGGVPGSATGPADGAAGDLAAPAAVAAAEEASDHESTPTQPAAGAALEPASRAALRERWRTGPRPTLTLKPDEEHPSDGELDKGGATADRWAEAEHSATLETSQRLAAVRSDTLHHSDATLRRLATGATVLASGEESMAGGAGKPTPGATAASGGAPSSYLNYLRQVMPAETLRPFVRLLVQIRDGCSGARGREQQAAARRAFFGPGNDLYARLFVLISRGLSRSDQIGVLRGFRSFVPGEFAAGYNESCLEFLGDQPDCAFFRAAGLPGKVTAANVPLVPDVGQRTASIQALSSSMPVAPGQQRSGSEAAPAGPAASRRQPPPLAPVPVPGPIPAPAPAPGPGPTRGLPRGVDVAAPSARASAAIVAQARAAGTRRQAASAPAGVASLSDLLFAGGGGPGASGSPGCSSCLFCRKALVRPRAGALVTGSPPFVAGCEHAGCYNCWLTYLRTAHGVVCPICRRSTSLLTLKPAQR
ncbi:hypothetical protein H696_04026 [Fonticula alba]|uniref:DNA helicase n=1 Tax=Fonticula alba TaxID=691883 RepID=A0A058Z7V9_FONAL|nr:hypothetical protein H696_04026 [Fonticula alba]KCV69607.1 hypothetical protein H696_04026 [Fonticula alba]|eukprot:XP_009496172.1 hypothetical protein H696_04026 [Fonticula alba]